MCKGISVRVSWHGVGHISICWLTIRNVLGNLGLKNMKLIKKFRTKRGALLFLIVRNHTSTTMWKPVRTFHSFYTHHFSHWLVSELRMKVQRVRKVCPCSTQALLGANWLNKSTRCVTAGVVAAVVYCCSCYMIQDWIVAAPPTVMVVDIQSDVYLTEANRHPF